MHEESTFPIAERIIGDDDTLKVYADGVLIDKIPKTYESSLPVTLGYNEVTVCGRYNDDRHIDGELVPMLCTQCGGRLDPNTLCCKFCGTYYKLRK